eukprot:CFRG6556T1
MDSRLKLSYFDFRGRAEPIRACFAYGNIDFLDHRVSQDEWPAMKANTPFFQLPVLEVDGLKFSQGYAILRYAGKLAGLYPEDYLQAMRVDEVLNVMDTMITNKIAETIVMQNDSEKKAERERLATEVFPPILSVLNEYAKDGLFADKLSIADLALYEIIGWTRLGVLDHFPKDLFDSFPNLTTLANRCMNDPKLQEYYANRPFDTSSLKALHFYL